MEKTLRGFAPVWNGDIRRLVIGSMPSAISLQRNEYFANPRNAFWPIAGRALGFPVEGSYEERTRALLMRGVGLWDAAKSCRRPGSLDSAMREVELNDFGPLLSACPALDTVLCNGRKAYELFLRAPGVQRRVRAVYLPSTSPAHAALGFEEKLAAWGPYLRGEQ